MSKTNSFRDYYYDHSDIFLAFILIVVAAGLVFWRVDIIMDYPKTLDTNTSKTVTSDNKSPENKVEKDKTETITKGASKATWKNDTLAEDITVELRGKKEAPMVQALINAGIFISKDEYEKVCKEAKRKHQNIRKGTYTFTKGMNKEKIVKLITD
ncbi:hypothetical protein HMPREF0378_1172 [Eubacterium nodatum ATCC 33099]|nr:hypothetical protein HMPREF0378_1172 [Eubacterium nodatum ATCC 33099]